MIAGDRVTLRAAKAADLPFLAGLRSNEALQRLLASRARGSSIEATKAWVERLGTDSAALLFVIADASDDAAVGYIQITGMDLVSRYAELGICLAPEHQGQGLGGEALAALEQYVARAWNLRKVVLHVLAGNDKAVALYRRHGFVDVGVLRGHFFYDGTYEDVLVMEHLFG